MSTIAATCDERSCLLPAGHEGHHRLKWCAVGECPHRTQTIRTRFCEAHEPRTLMELHSAGEL